MLVFGALYYKSATHSKKGSDSKDNVKEGLEVDKITDLEKQPLKTLTPSK